MERESANYERRVMGWLTDKIISLIFFALYFWLFLTYSPKDFPPLFSFLLAAFLAYLTYIVLYWIFMTICSSSIGMLIFRTKAQHLHGERITGREAFIRGLLSGITAFAVANVIYMLMAHTERSAFDQLTESYMVRR